MTAVRNVREQLVRYSQLVYQKGWVANHEGNLSYKIGEGRYAATPTAFSKRDVSERDLIDVDDEKNVLRGIRRPFSEFSMHLAAYKARKDVRAVIHAHPPSTTAYACLGRGLSRPMIAESVVSLGPVIPLIPFALPGSPAQLEQISNTLLIHDVLILENHGLLAVGDSLEQAFLRMEYVEHLIDIESKALVLGTPRYLKWGEIQGLLDSRKRAGLGPESRGMTRDEAYGDLAKSL